MHTITLKALRQNPGDLGLAQPSDRPYGHLLEAPALELVYVLGLAVKVVGVVVVQRLPILAR